MKGTAFATCTLLAIAVFMDACHPEIQRPASAPARKLVNPFATRVIESFADQSHIYFTTIYGAYRMTPEGVIDDSVTITSPYLFDSRAVPRSYGDLYAIPYREQSGNLNNEYSIGYYIQDKLVYSIPCNRYYDSDTQFGVLLPSDNRSLGNNGSKALLFLSTRNDATQVNFLIEYSIETDSKGLVKYDEKNRIGLPASFGADNFYSFKDEYIFSGYNETDVIDGKGNFLKTLDYSFEEIKSLGDSLYGFTAYGLVVSVDGQQWKTKTLKSFMHGKIQVLNDKLINLSGTELSNLIPDIIDPVNNKISKLNMTGVTQSYDTYLKSYIPPQTTGICSLNGKVYMFTSTGIYSRNLQDLFPE